MEGYLADNSFLEMLPLSTRKHLISASC